MDELPVPVPRPRQMASLDELRRFPPSPSSVAAARRFVSARVEDPALVHHASLLVSELATNAVVHARTPFEVRVRVARGVRVEVTDHSRATLRLISGSPDGAHGRGLQMVDAIASAWGVEDATAGKRVWFDLDVPPGAVMRESPGRCDSHHAGAGPPR